MKIEFKARLRMLDLVRDERGPCPLPSGYREGILTFSNPPQADETDWWCSEVILLDRDVLDRGEEAEVDLRLWAGRMGRPIGKGATFRISERHRVIGEGEVLTEPVPWTSPGNVGSAEMNADFSGYSTPEEAARGDIPERFTKVVWCERRGNRAVVLLQVNTEPAQYFDLAHCWVEEDEWVCDSEGGRGDERPEWFAEWLAGFGPA